MRSSGIRPQPSSPAFTDSPKSFLTCITLSHKASPTNAAVWGLQAHAPVAPSAWHVLGLTSSPSRRRFHISPAQLKCRLLWVTPPAPSREIL